MSAHYVVVSPNVLIVGLSIPPLYKCKLHYQRHVKVSVTKKILCLIKHVVYDVIFSFRTIDMICQLLGDSLSLVGEGKSTEGEVQQKAKRLKCAISLPFQWALAKMRKLSVCKVICKLWKQKYFTSIAAWVGNFWYKLNFCWLWDSL